MNKSHIKEILDIPAINFYQSIHSNSKRHFSYFNPHTSENYEFDCRMVRNNGHIDMHVTSVQFCKAAQMHMHHQNYIKQFRSFILATLIGGMKRYNNAKLILCKSEKAAKRYSNLGGIVVRILNSKNGQQWGVVK